MPKGVGESNICTLRAVAREVFARLRSVVTPSSSRMLQRATSVLQPHRPLGSQRRPSADRYEFPLPTLGHRLHDPLRSPVVDP